jgi:hypothetical protein
MLDQKKELAAVLSRIIRNIGSYVMAFFLLAVLQMERVVAAGRTNDTSLRSDERERYLGGAGGERSAEKI